MMLPLLIIATSFILTIVAATRQTMLSFKTTLIFGVILSILSGINIWNIHKQTIFNNRTLEQIASRIHWSESKLTAYFVAPNEINTKNTQVFIKIYSGNETKLSGGTSIKTYLDKCRNKDFRGFSFLSSKYAEGLAKLTVDEDGSIDIDNEKKLGIEHFWFYGKSKEVSRTGNVSVTMELEIGADANSHFTSLSDLNNGIIVAEIQTYLDKSTITFPNLITWDLKTNAGKYRLTFPFELVKESGTANISKFSGTCIPANFFYNAAKYI